MILIGTANTQDKAVSLINELHPDLILLDVELHGGDGFEVLKRTADKNYQVIFTTALYDEALNIINLSGVPVLQKPLDCDELNTVLNKFGNDDYVKIQKNCLEELRRTLQSNHIPKSIALNVNGELQHVLLEQIKYLSFKEGKLLFYLSNGSTLPTDEDIKLYEKLLANFGFFRVSATEMVNLFHVEKETSYNENIKLKDGSTIALSPKKRIAFFEALQSFKPGAGSSEA